MSKFLDAVRTSQPYVLYSFDVDRAVLDSGVVTDIGSAGINGSVNEASPSELEPVPSLIPGLSNSLHFSVHHDYGEDLATTQRAYINAAGLATDYHGWDNSTVEFAVQLKSHSRGKNKMLIFPFAINTSGRVPFAFTRNPVSGAEVEDYGFRWNIVNGEDSVLTQIDGNYRFLPDTIYHIAIQRQEKYDYLLYVNGEFQERINLLDEISETFEHEVLSSADLRIGGWSAFEHGDCTIGMFAVYDRVVSPAEIKEHYNKLEYESSYPSVEELASALTVKPESLNQGVVEPYVDPLGSNTDSDELWDQQSALSIQTNALVAGTTYYKTKTYDLTEYEGRVSTVLDYDTTTDANSAVDVEYRLDEGSWSSLTEGTDTIPEFDNTIGGPVN